MRESGWCSLWLHPFALPPPRGASPCSAASQLVWAYPTSHPRERQDYGLWPSLSRPRLATRAQMRSPSFCAGNFPTCTGSPTARDRHRACDWRPVSYCLPQSITASASRMTLISRLNTWPVGFPCQRFACALANAHA